VAKVYTSKSPHLDPHLNAKPNSNPIPDSDIDLNPPQALDALTEALGHVTSRLESIQNLEIETENRFASAATSPPPDDSTEYNASVAPVGFGSRPSTAVGRGGLEVLVEEREETFESGLSNVGGGGLNVNKIQDQRRVKLQGGLEEWDPLVGMEVSTSGNLEILKPEP